jgi:hypothetical protein
MSWGIPILNSGLAFNLFFFFVLGLVLGTKLGGLKVEIVM